ncbi:hypothetical protein BJ875DRAFT_110433 [Amylocarpus encephaloides]|uniref:Phosphoribulokinase/uridine kinase domain-containing protein n=1 Tax=Amylocarpus encephaloides TaxID=45428 RepID=A0A9P8C324_9HELO|nr:hypothetical protein BJ875DRAFT_110433 [Amylocarpus encephaloides]
MTNFDASSTKRLGIPSGEIRHPQASTRGQRLDSAQPLTKTKNSNIVVIGISGCSSSGKTTLTFLLDEIFNSGAVTTTGKHIIMQDDFFRPKSELPDVVFVEQDTKFLKATIQQGTSQLYDIQPFIDEKMKTAWKITGPDADCAAAVNFDMLSKAVVHLRRNGEIPEELEAQRKAKQLGVVQGRTVTSNDNQAVQRNKVSYLNHDESMLRQMYGSLIQELRRKVKTSLDKMTGNLRFVFVEGFLLFKDPGSTAVTTQDRHRQTLQSCIDIPLFVTTSRVEAKNRRLSRKTYLDPPLGERLPGQMWKGEGYFEDVVWNGYIAESGWLLNRLSSGKEDRSREKIQGIWVRSKDQSVEETLRWGVETILQDMWAGSISSPTTRSNT